MKRHVSRLSASIALPSELKIDGWSAGTIKLPFRRLDTILFVSCGASMSMELGAPRSKIRFSGVGRLRTYISFTGVLVKAPPWIVTAPSSTVMCSAYMNGLPIYGIKRPRVGNLSSRPTILSLKPNCLRWRRSARRSPITSKIIWRAGKAMRRVGQGCHEEAARMRRPLLIYAVKSRASHCNCAAYPEAKM
jgi:hypothetical protein